jgi:spore maturation protein CgeB
MSSAFHQHSPRAVAANPPDNRIAVPVTHAAVFRDLGIIDRGDVRIPSFERLMLDAARRWPGGRFAVAGMRHLPHVNWPSNIECIDDIAVEHQHHFYAQQRYTLLIADEPVTAQLLEAVAAGSVIITDDVSGIDTVLRVGEEFLLARSARDVIGILVDLPEEQRRGLAAAARDRVVRDYSPAQGARLLLEYGPLAGVQREHSPTRGPDDDPFRRGRAYASVRTSTQ